MGMRGVFSGVAAVALVALTPGVAGATEVPTLTRLEAAEAVVFAWPGLAELPAGAELRRCPRVDDRPNVRVCRTGTSARIVVRELRDTGGGYLVWVR